ncbi:MAG: hypothetical protein AAFR59_19655 [Bacteroidota bacterium]
MTLTYLSYGIYLGITLLIILQVGHQLHSVGARFIRFYFPEEGARAQQLNNLLLLGFYLVNMGYAVIVLTGGSAGMVDLRTCIEWIVTKIGSIMLILALLHVNNMLLIAWAHKIKKIAL